MAARSCHRNGKWKSATGVSPVVHKSTAGGANPEQVHGGGHLQDSRLVSCIFTGAGVGWLLVLVPGYGGALREGLGRDSDGLCQ